MSRMSRTRFNRTPAGHPLGGYIGMGADDLKNVPFDTEWLATEFVPTKKGLLIILTPEIPEKPDQENQPGAIV